MTNRTTLSLLLSLAPVLTAGIASARQPASAPANTSEPAPSPVPSEPAPAPAPANTPEPTVPPSPAVTQSPAAISATAPATISGGDAATPAAATGPEVKKLAVGTGSTFQPGLLLQAWFTGSKVAGTPASNTFRMRRAEISAKGDIVAKRVGYAVMFDAAKLVPTTNQTVTVANGTPLDPTKPETVTVVQPGPFSVLQDLMITAQSAYVDVSMGQFKVPVSYEGFNSSSKLLLPERALVATKFGDKRDVGLRLAKTFKHCGYSAGVWNGAGPTVLDGNKGKDAGLRLEAYPVAGLTVAGVVYRSIGQRSLAGTKDRYEGDVRFENGPLVLLGEYIRGRDVIALTATTTAAVSAHGFYAAGGFMVLPGFQIAARVGYLDPNVDIDVAPATATADDEVTHYEGQLAYIARGNEANLKLAYSRFQYQDRKPVNTVIFAAQAMY